MSCAKNQSTNQTKQTKHDHGTPWWVSCYPSMFDVLWPPIHVHTMLAQVTQLPIFQLESLRSKNIDHQTFIYTCHYTLIWFILTWLFSPTNWNHTLSNWKPNNDIKMNNIEFTQGCKFRVITWSKSSERIYRGIGELLPINLSIEHPSLIKLKWDTMSHFVANATPSLT
jgi:hypothetical protein